MKSVKLTIRPSLINEVSDSVSLRQWDQIMRRIFDHVKIQIYMSVVIPIEDQLDESSSDGW